MSASLQDESLPSTEMALILHRKGFDCGLEARNLGFNCTTTQGLVSVQNPREPPTPRCRAVEGGFSVAGCHWCRLVLHVEGLPVI